MKHFLTSIISIVVAVGLSLTLSGGGVANLGATITQIDGDDLLSDLDTLINTVSSELNTAKLDNSDYYATTTHDTITSIPNLATVGTIGTGTWQGSVIGVAFGGTGSSTPTGILYGDGAGAYDTIPFGTSGQFLQSNGAGSQPSFETSSIDQGANFTWTGLHTFNATTTQATSTFNRIGVGTSSPYAPLSVVGEVVSSFFTATSTTATTTLTNVEITGLASTTAYVSNLERVTNSNSLDVTDEETTSATASCSAGNEVLSGGHSGIPTALGPYQIENNSPSATLDSWTVTVSCQGDTGADCGAGTLTVYAICADLRM